MASFCIKPRPQSNPVECAPACIKMVLDAFSRKYGERKISLSMKKIKKLIRYNPKGGTPPDYIADGLNTHLSQVKLHIKGADRRERIATFKARIYKGKNIDFLRASITRTYPIVSTSLKYFTKNHVGYHPDVSDNIYFHDMVLIYIDENYAYLVDPLRKYMSQEINTCYRNSFLGGNLVLPPTKIPINIFEKAWDETYKWVLLIEEHIEMYGRIEDWIGDKHDKS